MYELMTRRAIPCPPKLSLERRPSLARGEVMALARLYKCLANPTRVRLLYEIARAGEQHVSALCDLTRMKPQAVSNQLRGLSRLGIVATRRNGKQIYYSIADPCVPALLDRGLCLVEDAAQRRRRGK